LRALQRIPRILLRPLTRLAAPAGICVVPIASYFIQKSALFPPCRAAPVGSFYSKPCGPWTFFQDTIICGLCRVFCDLGGFPLFFLLSGILFRNGPAPKLTKASNPPGFSSPVILSRLSSQTIRDFPPFPKVGRLLSFYECRRLSCFAYIWHQPVISVFSPGTSSLFSGAIHRMFLPS